MFTQNTRTEILLRLLVQMLCMTQNTRPPQLEKRYSLFALELELSVYVQSRNDHKTGVHFKKLQYVWYILFFLSYHGFDMQKNTG